MLKKIVSASVVTAALLFSGCGGDSEGEDRLKAQHAVDSGDSATAISLLEAKVVKTDADKMLLASAYMQKAGMSMMDVVSKLDTESDSGDDSFGTIADSIVGDANGSETIQNITDINKAIAYYESMSNSLSAAPSFKAGELASVNGGTVQQGFAYLAKFIKLLSLYGDVKTLAKDQTDDPAFDAAADIIKCHYHPSECAALGVTQNNHFIPYYHVSRSGKDYYRLYSSSYGIVVLDYPALDAAINDGVSTFEGIVPDADSLPFGESYALENQVLQALNDAYTLILDLAPDDVKDDMRTKFEEIDTDKSGAVSIEELRTYMAKE